MVRTSAHYSQYELFFDAEVNANSPHAKNDYMVISLDRQNVPSKELDLYLSVEQAERLAKHILSQIQQYREKELHAILTEISKELVEV